MKNYLKEVNSSEFEKLAACEEKIADYEKLLQEERERKNTLLQKMQNSYTEKLKGKFFRIEFPETVFIGQLEDVYFKSGKFFVRALKVDVTVNGKVMMSHYKIELSDDIMGDIQLLSEDEYKIAFYDYVSKRIRIMAETRDFNN